MFHPIWEHEQFDSYVAVWPLMGNITRILHPGKCTSELRSIFKLNAQYVICVFINSMSVASIHIVDLCFSISNIIKHIYVQFLLCLVHKQKHTYENNPFSCMQLNAVTSEFRHLQVHSWKYYLCQFIFIVELNFFFLVSFKERVMQNFLWQLSLCSQMPV